MAKQQRTGLVIGLAALLVTLLLGLALTRWLTGEPALVSVRGVLLEVRASSLIEAEQITLRTDDGQRLTFRVDPEVTTNREEPQSASHLRQHMALGDPLIVRYRATPDGLVAVRILDAR